MTPLALMRRLMPALVLLLTLASALLAVPARADDFLDPDQAFKVDVQLTGDREFQLNFTIAPGYYMYRDQFKLEPAGATLGDIAWPTPKRKFDETFQKEVETYRDRLSIKVPVTALQAAPLKLVLTGQGCADKGLCYPPMKSELTLGLKGFGGDGGVKIGAAPDALSGFGVSNAVASTPAAAATGNAEGAVAGAAASRSSSPLDEVLASGRLWLVIGAFFAAGVLLSLTPCVLPMLPILSSIIVGQGGTPSRARGFFLAFSYSLGMALLYTALGVAAGLAGGGLAAYLQKPWVLALFALLLIGFSLSMFGVYEIQLPSRFTGGVSDATQRLPAGKFFSVFVMGALSALIVSPCVAAPLAGALLYISQTGNVAVGGLALFALAWGMSVPLLLLGLSAGTLLPRAGPWMETVKYFFGLLLLSVALWIVQPVLPAVVAQLLWGALLIALAALLGLFQRVEANTPRVWLRKSAAVAAMVFGVSQFIGVAAGGTDTLKPLAGVVGAGKGPAAAVSAGEPVAVNFRKVKSVAELDEALRTAGKPVMLDFYADWCVSCKEMERFTFTDARVQAKLAGALLLKADVTANNAEDRELLKRFKLFGPPGTIFFDPKGAELAGARVIGFQDADRFLQSLQAAGL
ncbi:thiol:disulfide interchange protein DsbD [Mitsuaria sp. BK045]|uniref:protein-disulfide reductase DsbD n=1 Tax=unclassified Roseateles TaxID=2626991 RepID=UPI00161B649A|nr:MULTISPECIES: protein-disulfide reductase DsbD [unclassified Roseateles]MBB3295387.1 thiol:disulfide interchange protein DsbD [Mitsuaria sp. BK041]MBB3364603.1 thiol:disulfide interchange protein DsbD [Mitsuaria sp. BK045]